MSRAGLASVTVMGTVMLVLSVRGKFEKTSPAPTAGLLSFQGAMSDQLRSNQESISLARVVSSTANDPMVKAWT